MSISAMLLLAGGAVSVWHWQIPHGAEVEMALGAFLIAVGGLVALYSLAFPKQ